MKTRISLALLVLAVVTAALLLLQYETPPASGASPEEVAARKQRKEDKARFHEARMRYEFDMLKDPATGRIPENIREKEIAFARRQPVRDEAEVTSRNGLRTASHLTFLPAGPNNVGGRTRAIAYDVRYNGTSNRVIIAGCVSGGIMRSADGGNTWDLVTPEGDIHAFTALAQDPRPGFQDTWYAGGGEAYGNSASELGAAYQGYGIWKSTDNGASWTKLSLTNISDPGNAIGSSLELFDNPFDYVHRLVVNPVNGYLYIAAHRRVFRSTDGGASFVRLLGSTVGATSTTGQTEVAINKAGRVVCAFNGGNPDAQLRGVWMSATGEPGTFSRIAGGTSNIGVDSVQGWRGNDYESGSKRIIMTYAPSNDNILYVMYENGLSSESPELKPEGDLFRLDISGSSYTWTNLSANMPDIANGNLTGSDPLTLQGGYNMLLAVKPDNANVVFVGGTNLYRSTNGFTSATATAWINGYHTNFTYALYPNGHADIHALVFNPSNTSEAICGDDGGIRRTANIMATTSASDPVDWNQLPNYQTLQYYHVAIDPDGGRNNFAGGAQDNGIHFRDKLSILGTALGDSNNHRRILGGDGASVSISKLELASQNQYLYGGSQFGNITRVRLTNGVNTANIRPNGLTPSFPGATTEFGEFVTNFRLDPDNTEDLYYVNYNRLFRTTAASSVSAGGWTELTGVSSQIDGNGSTGGYNSIRALGFSRGPYASSHALYLGTTQGKIFRIDDPRNVQPTYRPVDITPTGLPTNANVQDISVNPNNDDEVLAVVSNYGVVSIWWTTNGKAAQPTWRNMEGNLTLPSIRSCAIVVKKDAANIPVTEYYVGTSVGLYSTADLINLPSGQTPTWEREGDDILNYAVVQSLAYRPADNVLVAGTHGNGMFYSFLGTPNYTPNLNTGIEPVTNDRNFIRNVFPTAGSGPLQYRTGNMSAIRRIRVQLLDASGRTVLDQQSAYQDGTVPLDRFASGTYILLIQSEDRQYRHLQKIIKQ